MLVTVGPDGGSVQMRRRMHSRARGEYLLSVLVRRLLGL